MKKKKSSRIFTLCYLLLVFSITLVLAVNLSKEGNGLLPILGSIHFPWLLAAIGCMALFILIESWVVWYITAFMYKKLKFSYLFKLDLIGNYYGALTPSSLGFQPSQIAYMKRDGIPVGISTCIQTIKLLTYEVVTVLLCTVFMSIKGAYFYSQHPQIFWMSILGVLINLFVILMMFLAIGKQEGLKRIVIAVARLLAKIRLVKNLEKVILPIENTLAEFHDTAKYLKAYKRKVVFACMLTLWQWLMFFSIPYCLYNGFGLGMLNGMKGAFGTVSPFDEAITLIAMAAFLFLSVHFIPIPGAGGATEAGFGLFFGSFFFAKAAAAMLLWRLITYYTIIIIGFVLIFIDSLYSKYTEAPPSVNNI